jgi:hypothetical protein
MTDIQASGHAYKSLLFPRKMNIFVPSFFDFSSMA